MRTTSAIGGLFMIVTGTAAGQYFRGVNVSQAEWGDPLNENYEIGNYTYATAPTFNYFAARALPFIRLQVKWERLQPTLDGTLDATQLGYLQQDVAYAKAAGAVVSICPHNEARYATLESQVANYDSDACIIDNPCPGSPVNVTTANFVNFWTQMSTVFKDDPTVVAYDLTNEPHDMGVANWGQIAQAAVTAVRNNGDTKTIMIEGDGWANATYWASYNGSGPFISDPANNYYYEAHEYFDSDYSGTYAETYDQELAANPRLDRWFVQDLNKEPVLPLADASLDAVMICVGVQYLQQPVAVMRELARTLRPGAPLVISLSPSGETLTAAWRGAFSIIVIAVFFPFREALSASASSTSSVVQWRLTPTCLGQPSP